MKRKLLVCILAALMIVTSLVGCNSSKPGTGSPTPTPGNEATPAPSDVIPDEPTGYNGFDSLKISETPLKVTLFSAFGNDGAPTGEEIIWQEGAKITNVSMENVANPSITEPAESLNVMLTGSKLPDIIYGAKADLSPVVQQGGFIPLDDLIAEHAPNIQKYFETIPDARIGGTYADGVTYYIEGTLSSTFKAENALIPTMSFFIRQDWLDNLNLPVPKTFDEFKSTLYAFRNDDPNGNGEKDEIPFFFRNGSPVGLYQLFGVDGDWAIWSIDQKTDKVVYGRTSEAYKGALKELAQWYKDGVIDPEILTRGSQARQELLGNDVGGMTFDWYESTSNQNYNDDVMNANPGMKFYPMLPPADMNGLVKNDYSQTPISGSVWGISKDCADPVAVIKYMDFWFSETGSMLMTYGVEDKSYTMKDGKPVWTQEAYDFGGGIPNYMRTLGAGGSVYGIIDVDISIKTELAQEAYRMYSESNVLRPPFPILTFTEEEEAIKADAEGPIDTLWQEYEQQVLYGEKDVDSTWTGYIAEMNALGLQEVISAYNSAYDRYKALYGK